MGLDSTELQGVLEELVAQHGLPGAVAGVLEAGHLATAAAGSAHLGTGAPMRPQTPFLLGSITKTWVTTLLLTYVDRGRLGLDDPVRRHLPELVLADAELADALTVRQLLTHTSGIDGADWCPDDVGDGPEALTEYVDRMRELGSLHAPGAWASYCNPGFVVAGRLLEVLSGRGFDDVLDEELLRPLGLTGSSTSLDHALVAGAAVGHFPGPDGHRVTPRFRLPRALGPAGATVHTTVEDVLGFARVHLDGGAGDPYLSPQAVREMAAWQVDFPVPRLGSFGLSWWRQCADGVVVLSHGGGSLGGQAQLVVVPQRDVALVAFVNSAAGAGALAALEDEIRQRLDLPAAERDADPGPPADPATLVGRYERWGYALEVEPAGEGLLTVTSTAGHPGLAAYLGSATTTIQARPTGPRSFGLGGPPLGVLVGDGGLLLSGARLLRRTDRP